MPEKRKRQSHYPRYSSNAPSQRLAPEFRSLVIEEASEHKQILPASEVRFFFAFRFFSAVIVPRKRRGQHGQTRSQENGEGTQKNTERTHRSTEGTSQGLDRRGAESYRQTGARDRRPAARHC